MRVRTAQDMAVKHARKFQVRRIPGLTYQLLGKVPAGYVLTY
jgi:hypothetical protein